MMTSACLVGVVEVGVALAPGWPSLSFADLFTGPKRSLTGLAGGPSLCCRGRFGMAPVAAAGLADDDDGAAVGLCAVVVVAVVPPTEGVGAGVEVSPDGFLVGGGAAAAADDVTVEVGGFLAGGGGAELFR